MFARLHSFFRSVRDACLTAAFNLGHGLDHFLGWFFFICLPAASRKAITHRMAGWLVAALTLGVAILLSFGQLRGVFGFKTLLVLWGAYLGYWGSRGVLRDYNPDNFLEEVDVMGRGGISTVRALPPDEHCAVAFGAAVLARAIIVAAVVIALAVGA